MNSTPTELLRRTARTCIIASDRVATRLGAPVPPLSAVVADRKLGEPLHPRVPRNRPDGRRLALTFDLDYQRDTDALDGLVDLVDGIDARMSVCSIAALVERDPAPYRRAVEHGHEIVNHSWTHPDNPVLDDREFWHLGVEDIAEQVAKANEIFDRELGVRASGFRTPHFKDVASMIDVMEADVDTEYLSSVLATTTLGGLPYVPAGEVAGRIGHVVADHDSPGRTDANSVIQLPLTACPEHRWSPFCSYHHLRTPQNHSKGAGMHDLRTFERHWGELLDQHEADGYLSFYFDPHDVMRDADTAAGFRTCLERTVAAGWDVVTLGEMAAAWRPVLTR